MIGNALKKRILKFYVEKNLKIIVNRTKVLFILKNNCIIIKIVRMIPLFPII